MRCARGRVRSEKFNYVLSTNVRDENNIIEFIMHHLTLGFDHIYIIDHLSKVKVTDSIKVLPQKYRTMVSVFRLENPDLVKIKMINNIISNNR